VITVLTRILTLCERELRRALVGVALCTALPICLSAPTPALAVIHPASVLDGPANDILEVDGAAMAPDGSGGILYRKEVEGIPHVFAVPFANGHWGGPLQVDGEDLYGASQPAIAAGEGGRLLVVWVQPRNVSSGGVTLYELMSASLQPGAGGFGQAIVVDPNVGEPFTGDVSAVAPTLAMARDGAAYVVYRTIVSDCNSGQTNEPPNSACLPGSTDKLVDVRVARFQYLTWSSLGAINRAPQIAMRNPTAENAPAIGVGLNGNGVVAWQEPGSDGVARIWARRLFGTVLGNVLQASPEQIDGRPVTSDAEAPALAVGPYGQARIAYRIRGAPGSAVATTQLYLNSILSETAPHGSQLQGSAPVVGATQGGLGVPSAAIDQREDFRVAWTQGGAAHELAGEQRVAGSPVVVGAAGGQALTAINPAGGGTTAWTAPPGAAPAVRAREDYAQGAFQTAQLAGTIPGQVSGLALGGDGQGDALLAFAQGPPGRSEVLGDFVQAPPAPFTIETPTGWLRGGAARVAWEAAPDAVAGVTYAVYVDGRQRIGGLTGFATRLRAAGLGDGVHKVQVLATDASGQGEMSGTSTLRVDANAPIVRIGLLYRGRGVRVVVSDRASGVDAHATVVSFGDGHTTRRRDTVAHRYRRAGTYAIVAQVRDRVGNHATVHLWVKVR
jgi:hypothetical protein